jgi:hypothetical protein
MYQDLNLKQKVSLAVPAVGYTKLGAKTDGSLYIKKPNGDEVEVGNIPELQGTRYVFVQANGTDVENAIELQSAYDLAIIKTLPSTVVVAPGNYDFENGNFLMNTDYVNLVSLDGNRSIVFNGTGTIDITANNVFVKGVDVQSKQFKIGTDLSELTLENCVGGDYSFGNGLIASGTFTNCTGGTNSFGNSGTASGTFTNCTAVYDSFGYSGTASGKFYYCRLTSGTFITVSSGGRTVLCIDGNDNQNNQ